MERLNDWKYCNKITSNHYLSLRNKNCLIEINTLSIREGAKKGIFETNKDVLDLDCIEKNLAKQEKRDKRKTMDFSFGIKKDNDERILLVDYKLNAKSGKNIESKNIKQKISNSASLLGNNPPLMKFCLLVFNKKYIQEATNTIRRKIQNKPDIIVINNDNLKHFF